MDNLLEYNKTKNTIWIKHISANHKDKHIIGLFKMFQIPKVGSYEIISTGSDGTQLIILSYAAYQYLFNKDLDE